MHAIRAAVAYDGERFLDDGATVLVEDSTIAGVEPLAFDLPEVCPVTAYAGTLLPGLFDCHVHLVADSTPGGLERAATYDEAAVDAVIVRSLRQQAAAGVTTVRDLGDVGFRTLHHRDHPVDGLPRILAAGPPLTTPGGHCHFLGGVAEGERAIRSATDERADRGVDIVKVMASGGMLTPGSDQLGVQFTFDDLCLLVSCAHDRGLAVLAHTHSLAGAEHAVAAGVDGLEHFTCLARGGVAPPGGLIDEIVEHGVVVDMTLGLDQAVLDQMGGPPPSIRLVMAELGLDPDTLYERRLTNVATLREHGVRVVTGVDSGASPVKPHGSAWRAVGDLVRGGYSPAAALATATSGAAGVCGLGDRTGRLAGGYDADLLVVDGDLRSDIEALGRPVSVHVRGRRVVP
ncbi:MAG: amidohydrolase family protein [Actinomycetota bacterium]|nr:amidohydrolase family protein [Actinomycetota bacterium]